MSSEASKTDDSAQLDFASLVPIGLILSLAMNLVQGMNSVRATCQHEAPGPRNLNQNICNNYYVYALDTKKLEDSESN